MRPDDRRAQIEMVRKVLTPKGPLGDLETVARNNERARLRLYNRSNASCPRNSTELDCFIRAIAEVQDALMLLLKRAAHAARETDALNLLLEAASAIDMLETDLLEFPLATPAQCRNVADSIRASVLKPFESKHSA